jgi:hypothetical protein
MASYAAAREPERNSAPAISIKPLLQFGRERQQRDVLSALDRHRQPTLMPRAGPRHPAGKNLAAFLHECLQDVRLLVVDVIDAIDAEAAHFLLANIVALAALVRAARSTGTAATAWPPTRTAAGTATWAASTAATKSTTAASTMRMGMRPVGWRTIGLRPLG